VTDPIRTFEHAHGSLTKLALAVSQELRDATGQPRALTPDARADVIARLEVLRDELLQHFADEEEALFPFVRRAVPAKAPVVNGLEGTHDAICGAVVRLAHLAHHGADGQLLALYERFEAAYAEHSRAEADLFEELGRTLGGAERAELASLLDGISERA
jgi:iron-sulfur cluster repair protein YtfE (RIC family)